MDFCNYKFEDCKFFVAKNKRLILLVVSLFLVFLIVFTVMFSSDSETIVQETKKQNYASSNNYIVCFDTNGNPSHNCIGGWIYSPHEYTTEHNINFMKRHKWNYGLISSSISSSSKKESLISLSKECAKNNIAYHIMTLQDTTYLDNPDSASKKISELLDFIKENDLPIAGIHIDVEPHGHSDWKNGDYTKKDEMFQKYLKVLEVSKKPIAEFNKKYDKNLLFSTAVPAWFSKWTREGRLTGGLGSDLVREDRADMLVSMNYDNSKGNIDFIVKQTKMYFEDGANMIVGIHYEEYGATDEGLNNINNQIFEKFYNDKEIGKYFYGTAVYQNKFYSDWEDK